MSRYFILDRNSGYIFGDTADFAANQQSGLSPLEAIRLLDESLMEPGHSYEEASQHDADVTYDVYEDRSGGDLIPVVTDGQDQQIIDIVTNQGRYVLSVRRTVAEML